MTLALVLGGYVNGYSIVRELFDCDVDNIWLFDGRNSLASKSNKLTGFTIVKKEAAELKNAIQELHKKFKNIVIYPTDDLYLELLHEIFTDISDYCFVPFNQKNILTTLDKNFQYQCCEELSIPYPKTVAISKLSDLDNVNQILFPILFKPNKREDLNSSVFRSLFVKNEIELQKNKELLISHLNKGTTFLASEYIPGDDTIIFAYTGYRSKEGVILNEWIGKKLTQHPDVFGVFSSASNEAPETIKEQGRALLNGMDIQGIAEPEFKYDARDGKYKLMEINLRSMMWHRLGNLCGVKLQYTQWLDATNQEPIDFPQANNNLIHLVYMKHEINNLLTRRGYFKHFKHNVWGGDKRHFTVFNIGDIKPFIFDFKAIVGRLGSKCLRILKQPFTSK